MGQALTSCEWVNARSELCQLCSSEHGRQPQIPGGKLVACAASWNSARHRSKAAPPYSFRAPFWGCGGVCTAGHCKQHTDLGGEAWCSVAG